MPTPTIPTLTPIDSTNLKAFGYDEASKTFAVQFVSGGTKVYLYHDVPPAVVSGFKTAQSKGAFFARSIRPLYAHSVADPTQDGAAAATSEEAS